MRSIIFFIALALLFYFCNNRKSEMKMPPKIIRLMKKEIHVNDSKILFEKADFTEADLLQFDIHHSEWWVEDGWLKGKNPGNHPGMIIFKQDFPGNVLIEFEASTVSPSTHDINVMWNGTWIDSIDQRGTAYVAGLEGWWTGKVGIEKSPDYTFMVGTPLLDFKPGHIYKIQAGSIDGHCFMIANDELLLEAMDPDPIDNQKYTKIGFEAYSSYIQIKNVVIRKINWQSVAMKYNREF